MFRKIAVCFVLFIGFFYTMPQMKGAGTTLAYIFPGLPYWAGVVVVGAVITLNVSLGGMKGITLVQAFQYWLKVFAITLPIFVLASVVGHYQQHLAVNQTAQETAVTAVPGIERKALPAKAPKDEVWIAPFGKLTTKAVDASIAAAGTPEEKSALEANKKPYSLLYTYSLIIALVCGPAGLPEPIVARWLQELREVLNMPEVRDRLVELGVEGTSLDPAATAAFVGREVARWRQVVRDNNVTAS